MKAFKVGDREFGYLNPYIIAEIGVNHEGSLDRAKRLIEAAAKGGAHAAKFQTYKAETLATRNTSPAYWDQTEEAADSQFALFKRWDNFGDAEYHALARHCLDYGVDFLSTPFDLEAVDLLAPLAPVLKIASADITNVPLLRKAASTGLPLLVSVGASRLDEMAQAVTTLEQAAAQSVTLLHCVLNYPTLPSRARLAQIPELARVFGRRCAIGYSDHVKPETDGSTPTLEMASTLGAVVLEKHFTDDKSAVGNDHYHALDRPDLAAFVKRLARLRELYGTIGIDLENQASAISNARRRIVSARSIAAGETFSPSDLVALRSNEGIEITHWDRVVGRKAARTIANEAPLRWEDIA